MAKGFSTKNSDTGTKNGLAEKDSPPDKAHSFSKEKPKATKGSDSSNSSRSAHLQHAMKQLKNSFDEWKDLSNKENTPQSHQHKSSLDENAPSQEWLDETRDLLEKLNQQLDSLS